MAIKCSQIYFINPVITGKLVPVDINDVEAAEMIDYLSSDSGKRSDVPTGNDVKMTATKSVVPAPRESTARYLKVSARKYNKHFVNYDPSEVTGDEWTDKYDVGNADMMELTSSAGSTPSSDPDIMSVEKTAETKDFINNITSDEEKIYTTDTSLKRHHINSGRRRHDARGTDVNASKRTPSNDSIVKKGVVDQLNNGKVKIEPNSDGKLDLVNVFAVMGDAKRNQTGTCFFY